jgi:hypothetical protein
MTKTEAKRRCCRGAWSLLDTDFDNLFLEQDEDGSELSEPDKERMRNAWNELRRELARRGG